MTKDKASIINPAYLLTFINFLWIKSWLLVLTLLFLDLCIDQIHLNFLVIKYFLSRLIHPKLLVSIKFSLFSFGRSLNYQPFISNISCVKITNNQQIYLFFRKYPSYLKLLCIFFYFTHFFELFHKTSKPINYLTKDIFL